MSINAEIIVFLRFFKRTYLGLLAMTFVFFRSAASHGRRRVVTPADMFRSTYSPNTVREDTVDLRFMRDHQEELNEAPFWENFTGSRNNITAVENKWMRKEDCSQNHMDPLASAECNGVPQTIRCPYGWQPKGPYCVTLSLVLPYTQCPLDCRRFRPGIGTPVIPFGDRPGLCFKTDVIGLSLECPDGALPVPVSPSRQGGMWRQRWTSRNDREESSVVDEASLIACQRQSILPLAFMDHGNNTVECPHGFQLNEQKGGCVSDGAFSPEPVCRDNFSLASMLVDPYAFHGAHRLVCQKQTLIKGKLWCPEGYHLSAELPVDLGFGDIVRDDFKANYRPRAALEAFLKQEWVGEFYMDALDGITCFQILLTDARNCDSMTCESPELSHFRKVLVNWAYHQLFTDAEHVLHIGIPGGKDYKYTNSGARVVPR